ncbi:MAG: hypothetical protein AAGC43_16795 [Bacteroidota bacterium]
MKKLILITIFGLFCLKSYTQDAIGFQYWNVTEFVFDNNSDKYKETKRQLANGAIAMDQTKIFIKGHNGKEDKTYKIIEKTKEKGTDRDMYICMIEDEKFAIALSPDHKFLTVVGINNKLIYQMKY